MVLESIQLDGIYKLLQRPSPNKLIHSLFNQAYLFAVFDNTLYDSIVCIAIAPQQFNTGFWDSRVPPRFWDWVGFLLDSVRFLRDSRICFILIDSLIWFVIICFVSCKCTVDMIHCPIPDVATIPFPWIL